MLSRVSYIANMSICILSNFFFMFNWRITITSTNTTTAAIAAINIMTPITAPAMAPPLGLAASFF